MEPGRLSCGDARSNIPHMQLFHHLKQKFPDLRDNDVNESIQKYGLDRERCEEELSQRTQVHPGGYYGPWGRSSPASSRLTSPVRGSTPSTPTTPLLVNTSPGVLGGEYLVYSGGGAAPLFTSPPATSSPALHPSSAGSLVSYGWNPTVANGYRPAPRQPQDGPARLGDRDRSKSRSGTPVAPSSAPVVPNSFDPFSRESPERRRSADNHHHHHHHLPEARYSPPPARPAMDPPAGLAATATATTTFTTTTTNTTTFATLITTTATPTTTITTTTSTTINCTNLSPVDGGSNSSSSSSGSGGGGSRSSGRPPPGRRLVSSVHLIPVPPHGAHHAPGPPSSDGTVSVCGRSYTSVNLQLRQPSSEPQPPIQIRSNGSSLTYSTSSLDHRQGSRSSLQISIGPTGGTISAMRTNLDNKSSQANTAFHIQYSSGGEEGRSPTGAPFPTTGDVVGSEGVTGQVRRPQTWYVTDSVTSESRQRKSSLPECVGPPVTLHPFHYPPYTEPGLGYSAAEPLLAAPPAGPDSAHAQVLVQDQLARKQRMAMELSKQVEEKDRLEAEVEMMLRELQAREQQRKLNADTNTMRIEEVQQENQRLQSECYEMENRILRLAPDFDLEGYSTLTQPQPGYSEGMPPVSQPPLLTRGSSGSSLGSELGTPNTPNTPHTPGYLPTRPAPPPPAPPPPPLTNHGYGQYQGRGGERMEEASHKWGCSKCTFINHPDMNMCEMCDFPRFTIGTAPPHGQAATTASPHHQGPCYCHHRHSHHLHQLQHSTVRDLP
ncbi:mucin-19-like isoform X2 [Eriocheir sinensis]|uniref:mucin-19-like isoform X2 n=1 Tax=Eriocheir sinensis TaxID=95602 RepID=UPI0021C920B8|nr:mucin-19-like isoform X2 [Eriocheir sinensis]